MLNPTQICQNSLNAAFTEIQVAENWSISRKTLQAWRLNGGGPKFLKMGKAVRYLASDLAEFEVANKKESTSQ